MMFCDDFKHKCAVRALIKFRIKMGQKEFREWYLSKSMLWIKSTTETDFIDQWQKGNKGNHCEWK